MSERMMICGNADKCKYPCGCSKPHQFDFQCEEKCLASGYVCIPYEEKQVAQPAQPEKKRVLAYKEDWVTRAITAEVKVHQLQVENNKLREALAAIVGGTH